MTVLQHDPLSVFLSVFDHQFSFGSLSLTERNGLKLVTHVHVVSEFEDDGCGVGTSCQHENEWSVDVDLLVDNVHSTRHSLNVEPVLFSHHIVSEGQVDHFQTEYSD